MALDPRAFARSQVRLTVTYTVLSTKKAYRALTRDVGGDGVGVLADQPLNLGEKVTAELILPDRPAPVPFEGEVVQCAPVPRMAGSEATASHLIDIKFVTLDPKQLASIKQYVAMNALPPAANP